MSFFAPDAESWRAMLRRVAAATKASDPEDLLQAAFVRLRRRFRGRAESKIHAPSFVKICGQPGPR